MLNMKDILAGGVAAGVKNPKQRRMLQCLRWRQAFQHSTHYDYDFKGEVQFSLQQIPNGEMKGLGTGTFVWPAATVLAKYFEVAFPDGLNGLHVCELGSGIGLNGIVASLLGADKVVLTDQAVILPSLTENIQALKTACTDGRLDAIEVAEYDWSCDPQLGTFDIIIVSDCVLPKLYPIALLVQALDRVMGPTSIAFFSYEHRPFPEYDPRQEFARLAAEFNLKVEVVPLAKHHPDFCADDIEIWKVRRGSSPSSELGDEQQPSPGVECAIWGENQPFAQLSVQGRPITIQQNSETGIGGVLWPSSVVACKLLVEAEAVVGRYLASLPAGAAVIDLGAGCGLTSILLSRLGFRVLAMDREAIMPLLRSNLDSNGASAVETLPFDWTAMSGTGESEAVLSKLQSLQPSLVLCSDCLYNSTAVDPLLALLMRLRTKVLIVNEMRTALEEFLYLLRRAPEVKSSSFMLDIQDIDVRDEDLVIVRTESSFISAPPIRAVLINIA